MYPITVRINHIMEGFDLFNTQKWTPFESLGITNAFFYLQKDVIVSTWITIVLITILALIARYYLYKPGSIGNTIVLKGVGMAMDMVHQATQRFDERYCIFIAAIFIYIFFCNIIMIIPGCEEPTKDINTTIALALISFFYTQKEAYKAQGFMQYVHGFIMTPLPTTMHSYSIFSILFLVVKVIINTITAILSFPLELLSKLASVISLSFRLYGNIFGGSVIVGLWKILLNSHYIWQIIGIASGLNLVLIFFFGLFEGFIQAFVFSTLSITYLGIGLSSEH